MSPDQLPHDTPTPTVDKPPTPSRIRPIRLPVLAVAAIWALYPYHVDEAANEALRLLHAVAEMEVMGNHIRFDPRARDRAAQELLDQVRGLPRESLEQLAAAPELGCRGLYVLDGFDGRHAALVPVAERQAVQALIDRGLAQMPVPMSAWVQYWQAQVEAQARARVRGPHRPVRRDQALRVEGLPQHGFKLADGCWALTASGRNARDLVHQARQWAAQYPPP